MSPGPPGIMSGMRGTACIALIGCALVLGFGCGPKNEGTAPKPPPDAATAAGPAARCAHAAQEPGITIGEAPPDAVLELRATGTGEAVVCPGDELTTGQAFAMTARPLEPLHLSVVYLGPDGTWSLIRDGSVAAADPVQLPAEGEMFQLQSEQPVQAGATAQIETLAFVASRQPLAEVAPELAGVLATASPEEGTSVMQALTPPRGTAVLDDQERVVRIELADGVAVIPFRIRHVPPATRGIYTFE